MAAGLRVLFAAALAAGCALPPAAHAAGLRISPLRLDVSASHPSAQVELSNLGAQPVPVQVFAYAWRQENGQDVYEPTKDVFFAPPIVTVPASGKALVRLRLRAAAPASGEAAYRIYFQELPGPAEQQTSQMSFQLRFGVPLFVSARKPGAPALDAQVAREGDVVRLHLANRGSAHLKVLGVDVFDDSVDREQPERAPLATQVGNAQGSSYLLPGSSGDWTVSAPAGAAWLLVRTDDYSGGAAKGMNARGWLWLRADGA
ncbi:MAG TPA: fimbria/pilus periplasmic chaperone [Candidatus Binatia bacterium]|nr:fimbria/pilus periplasmic chaperone [Candidatus Binatia bacterium]